MGKLICALYFMVVFILTVPGVTFGLLCYSCAATGGDNDCEQYGTYEDAVKEDTTDLIKNCSAPYDQVCYIETFSDRGNTVSHIRDCGNGTLFSFTSTQLDDKGAYTMLHALSANNETRCVWDGQHQVCLSKCDEDLCNGPQLDNGVVLTRVTGLYTVFILLALGRLV